jgi:hypothetical protein
MHAHKIHAREVHTYEAHIHDLYAPEMYTHKVHPYEMHANKVPPIPLSGKYDLPPNLWAFIGVTYLIPPNYLSMIRRLREHRIKNDLGN